MMKSELRIFALISVLAFMVGCGGVAPSSPSVAPVVSSQSAATAPATTVQSSRQDFEGFSFEIPDKWKSLTPDRDKTKAMILLDGTSWQDCKAMIKVDVGKPVVPTAAAMASSFAKNAGGEVSPNAIEFDGESAAKATTPSKTLDTPREMMMIIRKDRAYIVMAAAVQGVDVTDALEQIRSTWKWAD